MKQQQPYKGFIDSWYYHEPLGWLYSDKNFERRLAKRRFRQNEQQQIKKELEDYDTGRCEINERW